MPTLPPLPPLPDTFATPLAALRQAFAWDRLRPVGIVAILFALMMSIGSATPAAVWILRTLFVASLGLLMFGLLEQFPVTPFRRASRWSLQLLGVMVVMPPGAFFAYVLTTGGDWYFWQDRLRMSGVLSLMGAGLLFGPVITFVALVRQREERMRQQALAFQLERSELERRAVDARLRLLQAQVQPHFLFNTLANVRALVRTGSPQAGEVLDSLVAYLRASVPHLDESGTTLGRELVLVRAYLELMHLRMPDRLQFTIHADPGLEGVRCPPMTLHTLVENAVRHGIDPSEVGGRIEVSAHLRGGRCHLRVVDTGVGLDAAPARALEGGPAPRADGAPGGLGTGLVTLRERLALAFGGDARLSVSGVVPHGTCAEVEFPA